MRDPTSCHAYTHCSLVHYQDARFVEERRRALQSYLRHVINLIVHINAGLAVDISRQKLEQTLPFFR